MRTTKPISTISFNSEDFLAGKLNELVKAKRLSFWAFIKHKPEDDEGGKKEHFHVYMEPSKMMQTDDIKEELKQFDPEHPDKPKTCIPCHSSDFGNWALYVLHDKRYLAMKGQSRRFHYRYDEIVTSDEDALRFMFRSIDMTKLSPYMDMEDAIMAGMTFQEFFARGTVPIPQVRQFQIAWDMLLSTVTYRNGKEGHPNENE